MPDRRLLIWRVPVEAVVDGRPSWRYAGLDRGGRVTDKSLPLLFPRSYVLVHLRLASAYCRGV